jgi:hypothetical protein
VFRGAHEVEAWLREVLDVDERSRLRKFLADESVANA